MNLLNKIYVGIALSILLFGSGYVVGNWHRKAQITSLELKASQADGQAKTYIELSKQQDTKIKEADEHIKVAETSEAEHQKESKDLRRKLANLYSNYHPTGSNTCGGVVDPINGTPGPDNGCLQLETICDNQRELIASLDREIADKDSKDKAKDEKIKGLEDKVAFVTKAYEKESLRANLLGIALEAQKAAARSERWKGRLEGALLAGSIEEARIYFMRR